jgi:hypothetical protein
VNETSDEEFEKMIIRMIDKLKRTWINTQRAE